MKEGLVKDTYEVVIKEIQTVITISYIIAVGIGMLFNYQKFDEFGNRKYYLAYDYSLMKNASLEAKKIFINWFISNSDKIELVIKDQKNTVSKPIFVN